MNSNINHEIDKDELINYVDNQLKNFFPDKYKNKLIIKKNINEAIDRLLFSLKHVKLPGYNRFSYLHSDLYAEFIYFLSNTIWINDNDKILATKLFYLNKTLNGINCMYDTKLPDVFLLLHCVGTVLGKANYSNYFVVSQNVTVGTNKEEHPTFGEGIYLAPRTSVIGKCNIANFTSFSNGVTILDQDTRENCIVVGSSPNLIIKDAKRNYVLDVYFNL